MVGGRGPIHVKDAMDYRARALAAEERLVDLEITLGNVRAHLNGLRSNPRIRHDPTAMMVIEDMRKMMKDPV